MKKRYLACLVCLLAAVLGGCGSQAGTEVKKIKIGVTVYDQYDTFISELMNHFYKDAEEKKDLVTVETLSASQNQLTQNKQVESMIRDGCDVLCVNLVDRTDPSRIIETAKESGIPVIFFNRELVEEDLLRWDQLYYVGADASVSGVMEGQIAAEICREKPETDRNGDGSIQYIIFEGEAGHQDAIVRSETCVNTLLEEGIRLEKLSYVRANWNRIQAQTKMSQMITRFGEGIELIMSNNDDMALGVIDAYKEAEISREDWPVIVGIDGTDPGLAAVQNGEMAGTVFNDQDGQARAMFDLAVALGTGEGLSELELIDGKYIRLPYQIITPENVESFIAR